jgi:hypothetical protein
LPDNPKRDIKFEEITYNKKIDAITLINDGLDLFSDFVDQTLKSLGCEEKEFQLGVTPSTFSAPPSNDCIMAMQLKNELILLFNESGHLTTKKIPLKSSELHLILK